jgi:hypothetical protein
MKHLRLITGVIALGSLWGFSECIIGAWLRDANLPAGAILTAIIAIGLMAFSKTIFPQRGVPLTMGLIAGTLRYINPVPIGTCIICSAIAIMGEGLLFELLWIKIPNDFRHTQTIPLQACLGIISGYIIYVGGYTITQILTPALSPAGFDLSNLIAFTPQILASGLLPAVIAAFTIPAVLALTRLPLSLKDRLYYPLTTATAAACWLLVIINTIIILKP